MAVATPCKYAFGLELCEHPWKLSQINLWRSVEAQLLSRLNVHFVHRNATDVKTFEPFTHMYKSMISCAENDPEWSLFRYSFDIGWSLEDLGHVAMVFNSSTTAKVVSYLAVLFQFWWSFVRAYIWTVPLTNALFFIYQAMVSFHKPKQIIQEIGFAVKLIGKSATTILRCFDIK